MHNVEFFSPVSLHPFVGFDFLTQAIPNLFVQHRCEYSQRRIPTQHDMLPQHHVYRNELNCECYNISLARRNIAP